MNDDQLLAWIQALVRAGRFAFTDHALTKHPVAEHFCRSGRDRRAVEWIDDPASSA